MPRICRCCDDVVYCIEMEDPYTQKLSMGVRRKAAYLPGC